MQADGRTGPFLQTTAMIGYSKRVFASTSARGRGRVVRLLMKEVMYFSVACYSVNQMAIEQACSLVVCVLMKEVMYFSTSCYSVNQMAIEKASAIED